jgi:formamidopyrimidine-DNA glycosylase
MPESIEIKIMCETINKTFKDTILNEFNICSGRYIKHGFPNKYNDFIKCLPLNIDKLYYKGKFIWIKFRDSNWIIMITLGLSGHFTFNKKTHSHYEFKTNKGIFYIDDVRNFGTIRIIDDINNLNKELSKKGIDVFDIKKNDFIEIINKLKPETMIGIMLLNQKYISGIGNYLRSDILYHAKISPFRKIKDLSNIDINNLYKSIKYIIKKSYDEQTKKGLHNYNFLIYGIKDNTKNKKGHISKRTLIGDRYIYWSPSIQI